MIVAVAANFAQAIERLESDFEAETGFELSIATGSTGKIYAQIRNGAPYDIFLAADQARPALLEEEGEIVEGSRFTYATGTLVLFSPDEDRFFIEMGGQPTVTDNGADVLEAGDFRNLALANPDLAPYGAAAMQVIEALGLAETLEPTIVRGENVGQALALITSGNAELGFVALSQVASPVSPLEGSYWTPSAELYDPIRQDAVLLKNGETKEAAQKFMDYLKSPAARATIATYGYEAG